MNQLPDTKLDTKVIQSWALVAHVCNLSYSGGRNHEGHSLKPAQAEFCEPLSRKTLHKNTAGGVVLGEDPELSPRVAKKSNPKYRWGIV
jgi:hypothetical protein